MGRELRKKEGRGKEGGRRERGRREGRKERGEEGERGKRKRGKEEGWRMRGRVEEREEGMEEHVQYSAIHAMENKSKGREEEERVKPCTNSDVQQSETRQYQKHTPGVWVLTQHSATLPPDPLLQPTLPRHLVLQTRNMYMYIL